MAGNPYHDAKGLFSTAAGDADGKASGGRSTDEVTQRAAKALHTVHVQYDDPKGGRASIRVPVSARTRDGAVKKAMERLSRFPHPISGYKNANVLRVTKK